MERLCELHSAHYNYDCTLGENELTVFLKTVVSRLGADQLLTPREITRDFLGLLNILYQNPETSFDALMNEQNYAVKSAESDPETISSDHDDLLCYEFFGKIPTPLLMAATGHSSEQIFMRYINPVDKDKIISLSNYFNKMYEERLMVV